MIGFLDPATIPAVRVLEAHFALIERELDACDDAEFIPWFDTDAYRGVWNVLGVHHYRAEHIVRWHLEDVERRGLLTETRALVRRIPGLVGAGFTWIGPGTVIHPHTDEQFSHTLRIHLGMRCDPACTMAIGDDVRTWEYGRCFVFDSTDLHIVRHTGTTPRVSFLVEVEAAHARLPVREA